MWYKNAAEPERQPATGENNAFRVVDLTRVPKVTEDDRVTGILATMGASSIVKGVDFGGVGDSNILKVLTGRLDDLSGPVDTSVFKMIITPSEDPSDVPCHDLGRVQYAGDGGHGLFRGRRGVGCECADAGPGSGYARDRGPEQMAQGTYDPKGDYKTNSLADNVTSTDLTCSWRLLRSGDPL